MSLCDTFVSFYSFVINKTLAFFKIMCYSIKIVFGPFRKHWSLLNSILVKQISTYLTTESMVKKVESGGASETELLGASGAIGQCGHTNSQRNFFSSEHLAFLSCPESPEMRV